MVFLEQPTDFKIRFEIVSCFLDCGGEFLTLLRADHKAQGNTWGVPAGKVEKSDASIEDAMIRELQEELQFDALKERFQYFTKVFIRFKEYDFIYHIFIYPLAEKPNVILNSDHKEYRWVTPQQALSMNLIQDEDACIELYYFKSDRLMVKN